MKMIKNSVLAIIQLMGSKIFRPKVITLSSLDWSEKFLNGEVYVKNKESMKSFELTNFCEYHRSLQEACA